MNPVADEIRSIFELDEEDDALFHYGMPRRSGRYPWGSGKDPYQRNCDFIARVKELKGMGKTEKEIAEAVGLKNTSQLRVEYASALAMRKTQDRATIKKLLADGMNKSEIAKQMGINESTVRSLLNEESEARTNQARKTADALKKLIDEKGMIDVGGDSETYLGVSKTKLDEALYLLQQEGYPVYGGRVPQATNPGMKTTLKVLCPPGTEHKEIFNYDKINSIEDFRSFDDGETFKKAFTYPESLDSKRLKIRYAEDGGLQKDGVIELRRGVEDISLGDSIYSQVRILVDGTHYLKGMAVYSDDMPDGVDVVFNTNKKTGTPMGDVLKKIKPDPDNPFGSAIKENGGQRWYIDADGNEKLSLINKRADEGDWSDWKDKLPAQFLSKQSLSLAKQQLKLAIDDKVSEYNEICSLTNPTVKKNLLQSFSEDCDSAAVHLYAAALPRQKYHVILPVNDLSEKEVYAPNYHDGEKVALIRYPHGGTFEIPILTVNNKNASARKLIGPNSKDAVGINSKVAERLSGADFDGDTVMVIPTGGKVKITSTPPLKGLEGFDPKLEYPEVSGMKMLTKSSTQNEMGRISNLITDMTLKGATQDELARAVRHSMVVIDAAKHHLNYKQSEIDNDIPSLRKKYQGVYDEDGKKISEGAATLISRAKSPVVIPKRKGSPQIDPETGKVSYKESGETYTKTRVNKRTGEVTTVEKLRTQNSTKMAETDDAYSLVSKERTPMELAYADFANKMKSLANEARKTMVNTKDIKYDPSAKATYQKEVTSLNNKLLIAKKNSPRERQAQLMAASVVKAKKQANPDMTNADIKKESQRALSAAREQVGAKKQRIEVTDKEWEAIQAGAISATKLNEIIKNADIDVLREKAMPRTTKELSQAKINKIKSLNGQGKTNAEIAKALGISASAVSNYLN